MVTLTNATLVATATQPNLFYQFTRPVSMGAAARKLSAHAPIRGINRRHVAAITRTIAVAAV